MKFVDEADVYVKAGGGGRGCVSFRRERFIPRGGPDGGDGGKGGDVIVVGRRDLASLLDFKYKRVYGAESGKGGGGKDKKGRDGKDMFIFVPLGTLVFDNQYPDPICDVIEDDRHYIIAKGGKGGRGNARFVTSTHRAPLEFDYGGEGEERHLKLVLKLLADVGIVGLPNVGKSTLIACLTDAKPRIGDYPFTTLTPTLGVFRDNYSSFVIADIPGIVKDASKGKGLGLTFLRHIERTGKLMLMLDVSSESPANDYATLLSELDSYGKGLLARERVLLLNKMDLASGDIVARWERYFAGKGEKVLSLSALTRQGIAELMELLKASAEN